MNADDERSGEPAGTAEPYGQGRLTRWSRRGTTSEGSALKAGAQPFLKPVVDGKT